MEKSKKRFVTYTRYEGYFDWCHPERKEAQYIFHWNDFADRAKELELKNGFTIELKYDKPFDPKKDDVLDVAYAIQDRVNRSLYCSYKNDVDKVVQFLESIAEENDALKKEYDIEFAKYQIEYWQNRLQSLTT